MSTKLLGRKQVLELYAALPEAYQPAWGLDETSDTARRASADRLAALLPPMTAMQVDDGPLRILDIGCAQGYFTLALQDELAKRGRAVEVVGVDYLEDNVRFCRALAAHHDSAANFLHDRFDADFFKRHASMRPHAVLALNVLHHVLELDGGSGLRTAVDAIRANSNALFCELAQPQEGLDWIDARNKLDEEMLAGYAFQRRLGDFQTHLGEVRRPLFACSDAWAWVGERWFGFSRVAQCSHPGVDEAFVGQRRFFFGDAIVVKRYRGDGQFGQFNREELSNEAAVLERLGSEPDRFPPVRAHVDDGDVVWLARGLLPGRLLSEAIDAGDAIDRDVVVRAMLEELAHLEALGFAHADLRCWNVLMRDSDVRLIDFGSMTPVASPLQRVALAAVLLEIARGKLSHEQPFYASIHPLDEYPQGWHRLLAYLLGTRQADFSHAGALRAFTTPGAQAGRSPSLQPAADVLEAVAGEQAAAFERLRAHAEEAQRLYGVSAAHGADLARTLERQTRDAENERAAGQSALAEAATYGEELQRTIQRQARDASEERKSMQMALNDITMRASELERSLASIEDDAGAGALRAELARADSHAQVCEARMVQHARQAEALQRELQEAAAHAQALQAARDSAVRHALSLERVVGEKDAYAASLEAERVQQAKSLAESGEYVADLKRAIDEKDAYAASLERERTRLDGELASANGRINALQRRFRLLKPMWPRVEGKERQEP